MLEKAYKDKRLQTAFEMGRAAYLSKEPVTACRLRAPARKNAWIRGWREAEQYFLEIRTRAGMDPEERRKTAERLSEVRDWILFR